jgi:predicted HicB family RNase H-like nuclease
MEDDMKTMQYKGYHGSVEISPEDNVLYGKLLFISPLITYEGATAQELEKAFQDAVDSYLEDCKADGIAPAKPCKGSFNVRVGHELHLSAAVAAHRESINLNEFIKQALAEKLQRCEM